MPTGLLVMLIILGVLLVGLIVLGIVGRRMQKKQEASQEQIRATAQTVSMLVIDKKRMRLKDAGFPQVVIDQTPKYLRRANVPVVKAKIGPKVASLMCDEKIFDSIPIKRECKVLMNGIYIIDIKSARGGLDTPPPKKGFFGGIRRRLLSKKSKLEQEQEQARKAAKKTDK
ncbi:MAG: hypothetical protein ILP10_05175 [Lachnospiraceae bacterium]|nr:hypothetical protein [Lachnospiraceae bacterium]